MADVGVCLPVIHMNYQISSTLLKRRGKVSEHPNRETGGDIL